MERIQREIKKKYSKRGALQRSVKMMCHELSIINSNLCAWDHNQKKKNKNNVITITEVKNKNIYNFSTNSVLFARINFIVVVVSLCNSGAWHIVVSASKFLLVKWVKWVDEWIQIIIFQ